MYVLENDVACLQHCGYRCFPPKHKTIKDAWVGAQNGDQIPTERLVRRVDCARPLSQDLLQTPCPKKYKDKSEEITEDGSVYIRWSDFTMSKQDYQAVHDAKSVYEIARYPYKDLFEQVIDNCLAIVTHNPITNKLRTYKN